MQGLLFNAPCLEYLVLYLPGAVCIITVCKKQEINTCIKNILFLHICFHHGGSNLSSYGYWAYIQTCGVIKNTLAILERWLGSLDHCGQAILLSNHKICHNLARLHCANNIYNTIFGCEMGAKIPHANNCNKTVMGSYSLLENYVTEEMLCSHYENTPANCDMQHIILFKCLGTDVTYMYIYNNYKTYAIKV